MIRVRLAAGAGLLALLLVSGCSSPQTPGAQDTPAPTGASDPAGSATPEPSSSEATPASSDSATPGSSATPQTPGPSTTPGGTATPLPTGTPAPASCSTVEPIGIGRITADPRRVTEVATVVSDGRTLTTGSTEETDLLTATLLGPDGTVIVDPTTLLKVATLVAAKTNHSVQLEQPAAPDVRADVTKRPFNTPGTYAMFNASSVLTTEVTVVCSGQQQIWQFRGEGDPARGTVNCAVEPGRGNVLGRSVYQSAC